MTAFADLGLTGSLLETLQRLGYDQPSPVQEKAIPPALAGRDLLASAQTGTGKTAGFALPLLQRLAADRGKRRTRPRALILTPTRELADQVAESLVTYGAGLGLRTAAVFGGANINPQIRQLREGVDILVATPGRLLDHLGRGTVELGDIGMLVLDEADRMLDMGFLPAIERILRTVPEQRQTLLFSATFPDAIQKLTGRFLRDPERIALTRPNAAAEAVTQSAYWVDKARKRELLSHLIGTGNWHQVLVFTRTKRGADRLARQLETDGIRSAAIHGNKSQGARTRALAAFKANSVRALVATDVAARGLDIDRLPHVVNYDLPDNPEDYVHRIGRTGRAGEEGIAVSLVTPGEKALLGAIEGLLKTDIPRGTPAGFEVTDSDEPLRKPAGRHAPRGAPAGGRRNRRPSRGR